MKIKALLAVLFFLSMIVVTVQADKTTIDIVVISEDDITGYINATSVNGSVSYFIEGVEVKGEFSSVWNHISSNYGLAEKNYIYADKAYVLAKNTNDTVIALSFVVENNTHKIYMLRDELVAFQNHYIDFRNYTIYTIELLEHDISSNEENISELYEWFSDLQDDYYELYDKHMRLQDFCDTLQFHIYLLLIPIFGFIICFFMVIFVFRKQHKWINNKFNKKFEFSERINEIDNAIKKFEEGNDKNESERDRKNIE
jgi:preprotein translocase subunit SecG